MIIVSWNIRGFHTPLKHNGVRDLLYRRKVDVCCLVETKLNEGKLANIMAKKFPGWDYEHNFAIHARGRIVIMWKAPKVEMEVLDLDPQYIHARLRCKVSNIYFHTTFIYGFHSIGHRRPLWGKLIDLCPGPNMPWLLLGDFNSVLNIDERTNGAPVSSYEMRDLLDATILLGLLDTNSAGSLYTWSNGTVLSKLDRVMTNDAWVQAGFHSFTHYLPIGCLSDHAAAVSMFFEPGQQCNKMFQFFNMWAAHPDFLGIVQGIWGQQVLGTAQYVFCKKLKLLKTPLKDLNKLHFSHIQSRAEEARFHLEKLQDSFMIDSRNSTLQQELRMAKERAWNLSQAELAFCSQKAKCRYLANSDRNSRLFHQVVKRRVARNEIVSVITPSGSHTTSTQEVCSEFLNYYQQLLGVRSRVGLFQFDVMSSGRQITPQAGLELVGIPTDTNIKDVVFHMGDDKSPGPDGYTVAFFKKAWSIVGPDLCVLVREFFQHGRLLRQLNHTIIALIPKDTHASTVADYRPIACCNVIYKVITKLLATRLAPVMNSVIHEAQAAFVQGRSLAENVLLAQELIKQYNRKRVSPRCVIKVDIRKAYDSVSWEFLEYALLGIGLPVQFVGLIMECVTTPTFSIRINGDLSGYFRGERGLRQGDPLSPYLFVICMEYFSRLLERATGLPEFNYHPRCATQKITHLIYADDLMLFTRGDITSIQIAWDCLLDFGDKSGLRVNPQKSNIFLAGVFGADKDDILQAIRIPVGTLPVRYLGIPLAAESLKLPHYAPLIKKLKDNIQRWQPNSLSYAGRLELIRSVLQGVSCFWLSILPVPQSVLDVITRICRQFFWNSKSSMVAWKDIVLPKEEGGLGLRDFKTWNSALLTKYIWDIHGRKESLWLRWIDHVYLGHLSFWETQPKKGMSVMFKRFLAIRDELLVRSGSPDGVISWLQECLHSGTLSVSAVYHALRPKANRQPWFKTVWCTLTPPKYAFCLWLAIRGRLRTTDRLQFMDIDTRCPFCGLAPESISHLFFECPHTRRVWHEISQWCGIDRKFSSIGASLRWLVWKVRGTQWRSRLKRVSFAATVYYIWLIRNRCRFEGFVWDLDFILHRIRSQVYRCMFSLYPSDLIRI